MEQGFDASSDTSYKSGSYILHKFMVALLKPFALQVERLPMFPH
jgi:hypothetical protein